jgi:hypothetical protein
LNPFVHFIRFRPVFAPPLMKKVISDVHLPENARRTSLELKR